MFKSAQTFFLLLMITSAAAQTVADKLHTYLSNTNRKNKFNGTALVAVNGQVVLHKGYGLKNVAEKTNNDTATIFMIGSITKTFTAAIILHLYGTNALNIADKLSAYIPDYPNGNNITIEHLLTHTTGIFDYLQSGTYAKEDFSKPISIDRLISFFKLKPLLFKPGSKFSYSNSNYILLAFIIEKVTGKKYEDAVKEKIFAPLQMTHSGFDFKNLADINKAINYDNIYKRKLVTNQVFDSTHAPGCGAIYATAGDLYKWDRALYSGNFIKESILQKAYTPYKSKYGYGWFVDNSYGNLNVFHGGGVPGFHSHIQRFVNNDVCIILLSNNAYCDLSETANRLASIIFDKPYEELTF